MKIKFQVKMTVGYMFDFMVQHIYRSFAGIMSIVLGLFTFAVFFLTLGKTSMMFSACYLLFTVFFLVYLPFGLWRKAKRQVEQVPMFRQPLSYTVDVHGITTAQNAATSFAKWEDVTKVVESKISLIVYVSKVQAFVWPKAEIGDDLKNVEKMIFEKVPAKRLKMRLTAERKAYLKSRK